MRSADEPKGLVRVGKLAKQTGLAITPIQARRADSSADIRAGQDDREIAFQHSYFCQTALPYRRVEERTWVRKNGAVVLRVDAGGTANPETGEPIDFPLPFGPKARLILLHLDTEAIRGQSPYIELEGSMTAFVKALQGRDPTGPELRKYKEQAAAISTATFRLIGVTQSSSQGKRGEQVQGTLVDGLDLWFPKDARQRVLWPSYVHLNPAYFEDLKRHAVPMDYRAIAALQHSALALDTYKWLSQRLYRVPANRPAFMPWTEVQQQFGQGYDRIRAFRAVFLKTLKAVEEQYPHAKLHADERGLTMHQSRPPIAPKQIPVGR